MAERNPAPKKTENKLSLPILFQKNGKVDGIKLAFFRFFFVFFLRLTLSGSVTCYFNAVRRKRIIRNYGDSAPKEET